MTIESARDALGAPSKADDEPNTTATSGADGQSWPGTSGSRRGSGASGGTADSRRGSAGMGSSGSSRGGASELDDSETMRWYRGQQAKLSSEAKEGFEAELQTVLSMFMFNISSTRPLHIAPLGLRIAPTPRLSA